MVRKRCDSCGARVSLDTDDGDIAMASCSQCGKKYRFSYRTAPSETGAFAAEAAQAASFRRPDAHSYTLSE
jgi:RNase P subunit RPR2